MKIPAVWTHDALILGNYFNLDFKFVEYTKKDEEKNQMKF